MAERPLTTTSYAILGLLAIKPWTTYELTRQMHRALGQFWPRAESKLYEEPKKLVAHGLAKATVETTGKRSRTVYAITPKGRKAMAAWVPTAGAGPQVEFEQLVKVFFAEHGTKADLVATIDGVSEWIDERYQASAGISQAYLDGTGSYPERLPWLILSGRFLHEIINAVERWQAWAGEEVASWPEDLRAAAPDLDTLAEMAAATEAYFAAASNRSS